MKWELLQNTEFKFDWEVLVNKLLLWGDILEILYIPSFNIGENSELTDITSR